MHCIMYAYALLIIDGEVALEGVNEDRGRDQSQKNVVKCRQQLLIGIFFLASCNVIRRKTEAEPNASKYVRKFRIFSKMLINWMISQ